MTTYTPYHTTILPTPFTWKKIDGWFDYQLFYDQMIAKLCGNPGDEVGKLRIAVEVGSWFGRSTAYFAGELKRRAAKHVAFVAVDTWEGSVTEAHHQEVVARHGGSIYQAWLKNMEQCRVLDWVRPLKSLSVEAAQAFEDGSVDFVFLDADHTTEGLRADIRAWRSKVGAGGTLAGHDADWGEVWAAVESELPGRARRVGRCWVVDM